MLTRLALLNEQLHVAAENNQKDDLINCIKNGAQPYSNNFYILEAVCSEGHLDLLKFLINKYNININTNNTLALRIACKMGNLNIVKYLVEHGADIHANFNSAFRNAVHYNHYDIAKFLTNNGANTSEMYITDYIYEVEDS